MTCKKMAFCPVPWNFLAVRSNGDLRICCHANQSKNKGIIRGSDDRPMNGRTANLEEARNSHILKEVRSKMLQSEWPEECIRCQREEENGLRSRRDYERESWNLKEEEVKKHTSSNGEIDLEHMPLKYIDLRFGNKCNLSCRMCGPADSTGWYTDHVKLTGDESFYDTHGKVELVKGISGKYTTNDYEWYESDKFWQQLSILAKKVVHIYMAGGEPLLIDQHYEFLDRCIEMKWASNIVLEYNTNLTVLDDKILNLWSKFKNVRVGASIDGIGPVFEYQRYPANWNYVKKNLEVLDSTGDRITAWLAVTITNYNIFHLPDMIRWKMLESGFKKINSSKNKPIITHHMCHSPAHLNIRSLPEKMKKEVLGKFNKLEEWGEEALDSNQMAALLKIKSGVIQYMMSEQYDEWPVFLDYTSKLDAIRNQNIKNIVPEFMEYF